MDEAIVEVVPYEARHRQWAADLLQKKWGSTRVITRGQIHEPLKLPGYVAVIEGHPVGLVTYSLSNGDCELVTINSTMPGLGIGSALVKAVKEAAQRAACRRLWLITTNDNMAALRFYQRRGFALAALYRNALEISRQLKPEIPTLGADGIPLRDEIELELTLEED